jgi:threonine dehydrogenase-like Zn-dependent dehydrogenase
MRALVLRGPHDIEVQEVADPVPGSGEMLLRITATGICGSDVHGYTGANGRRHPGQVMGHETVGQVAGGDPDALAAQGLTVGDRVTVNPVITCGTCPACASGAELACPQRKVIGVDAEIRSAFADLMAAPAANAERLPDRMPQEHGALVEPLSVGFHAARRGRCAEDDRVLVAGGGPIGQACLLAAHRLGASRVVVSEPNPGRAALVRRLGADVIDPAGQRLADAVPDALGGPPTLVLDAVGSTASLADGLAVAGLSARIVLAGMNEPAVQLSAYQISTAERELIGTFAYTRDDFASTVTWAATAADKLDQLIDRRVGWAGAAGAFAELASPGTTASKILVMPGGRD